MSAGWSGWTRRARRLVVAGVDRVEHLVDETRAKPVFLVDIREVELVRGDVREVVALGHVAPLDWTRCSTPMGVPALAQPPERS